MITPSAGTAVTPSGSFSMTATLPEGASAVVMMLGTERGGGDVAGEHHAGGGAGPFVLAATAPAGGILFGTVCVAWADGTESSHESSWPVDFSVSGFDWFEDQVYSYFDSVWPTLGQYEVRAGEFEDPPPLVEPNLDRVVAASEAYVEMVALWQSREQFGASPIKHFQSEGVLQHEIFVGAGGRSQPLMKLASRIEPLWLAADIAGVSFYAAQPPRAVSGPDGWWARQVDVPFRFEWSPQ